jgi:hypothetical protein
VILSSFRDKISFCDIIKFAWRIANSLSRLHWNDTSLGQRLWQKHLVLEASAGIQGTIVANTKTKERNKAEAGLCHYNLLGVRGGVRYWHWNYIYKWRLG